MKASILIGACFMFISGGALAESMSRLPPEMRLRPAILDQGDTSEEAVVRGVAASQIPESIAVDIKGLLAMCTGDFSQMSKVRAYTWAGRGHATKQLAPNYLVDFSAIKEPTVPLEGCAEERICSSEGCLLVGFTALSNGDWKQDFDMRSLVLGITKVTDKENDKITRTEIQTISGIADCKDNGGLEIEAGCYRHFTWRSFGLQILPPPEQ